jgi:hypothetical protein
MKTAIHDTYPASIYSRSSSSHIMVLTSEATQLLGADILEIVTPAHAPPKIQSVGNVLPGQPRVSLDSRDDLLEYLRRAFLTPALDRLAPRLWLVSIALINKLPFPTHTTNLAIDRNACS